MKEDKPCRPQKKAVKTQLGTEKNPPYRSNVSPTIVRTLSTATA